MKKVIAYDDIGSLAEDVEFLRNDYLRQRGWDTTCQTPGAFWVWTREYEGKQLMASADLAARMQSFIDGDEEFGVSGVPQAPERQDK